MQKFLNKLFSMRMMALAMLIFLGAIATATFIESTHDIQTAKIIIYNALWFELLLVYLAINLVVNIFRYRMFQREKIAMLTFHLAFIVIIIGAGLTRYIGFEGLMLIREGSSSDFIYASDPHLGIKINDGTMQYKYDKKMFMSEVTDNNFKVKVNFPQHPSKIKIEYVDFKKKHVDSLVIHDSIKGAVLEIVKDGMKSEYLGKNAFMYVGETAVSYEKKNAMPGVHISKVNGKLMVETKVELHYLPMSEMQKYRQLGLTPPDSLYRSVPLDSLVPFMETTLYIVNGEQFVFKREVPNSKKMLLPSGKKDVGMDYLTVKVSDGNESKIVTLEGGMSTIPTPEFFTLNGLNYELMYGSTKIELPFNLECVDFQLDRYPGSDVASSYASIVKINDKANNYTRTQRIFMNNVMDYNGYRFFQSSYDQDEKGTRLSVNSDWWGTNISYLGYLLLAIGMIMSLFAPIGRHRELLDKLKKSKNKRNSNILGLALALAFGFGFNAPTFAATPQTDEHIHVAGEEHDHAGHDHSAHDGHDHSAHDGHDHGAEMGGAKQRFSRPKKSVFYVVSEEHSDQLASLLVQDFAGRIIPMHTLADQLLRKVYGANKFKDFNAVQAVMSMHMYPDHWMQEKMILVPSVLREPYGLEKYVDYFDLIDEFGDFKYLDQYNVSFQKLDSKKSEIDKKLIKLVERFQVMQSVLSWQYMKIIPLKDDSNHMWKSPMMMDKTPADSATFFGAVRYFNALAEAAESNQWGTATDMLTNFKKIQREVSHEIVPTEKHVKFEIQYNKMNIFKNSMYLYFTVGILMLIIYFVRIFIEPTRNSESLMRKITIPLIVILGIVFVYHGYGLGVRWYVSGHAPWSNGYEAIIFITWMTMVAGFSFAKKNPVVLAGTAILAFFMLFVSELNLMDPEITPLEPVLKSYWLMIHVAIITGSYGFLGLGAILGLINMLLYIFRTKNNGSRLTTHINEITAVSELTMTIGMFMLTIGTFLGGVWANESWGRYWGWDPKETWALVSCLVYAVIMHLRFIPGLNGKFLFNAMSFWGYSSILFTFFGVNFYLVGLHSYAQGDGLAEIPTWLYYTLVSFALYTAISAWRSKAYSKSLKDGI